VSGIGGILYTIGRFYGFLIIVYVLMSWLPKQSGIVADVYRVLGSLVEPYLSVFRRFIPPMGGIDFSPVVAIIVLQLLIGSLARLR
jgi:YggT family protein